MRTAGRVAIPGEPSRYQMPPAGAPAAALAAIAALNDEMRALVPFGFLDAPLIAASYYEGAQLLSVRCRRELTRRGLYDLVVEWRWGELWAMPDWYEMGWHPDGNIYAVPAYRWRLWDLLNPGKRDPLRRRRGK